MSTDPEGIRNMAKTYRDVENHQVADTLTEYAILRENLDRAPQIIRRPADLEALDPDTMLIDNLGIPRTPTSRSLYYPAAVVRDGAGVRACREALERETR